MSTQQNKERHLEWLEKRRLFPMLDTSNCKTHEEFMETVRAHNQDTMWIGVDQGWWESVDSRGNPIPHPIELKISEFPTFAHVMVKLKVFNSITQARKNGFDIPCPVGIASFTKKNIRVKMIDG